MNVSKNIVMVIEKQKLKWLTFNIFVYSDGANWDWVWNDIGR